MNGADSMKSIMEAYYGMYANGVNSNVRGEQYSIKLTVYAKDKAELIKAIKNNPYVMSYEDGTNKLLTPKNMVDIAVDIGVTSDKDPDKFIDSIDRKVPLVSSEKFGYI
jgi:hypothetical protein